MTDHGPGQDPAKTAIKDSLESSLVDEIISAQKDDLYEEDSLLDSLPRNTELYRDSENNY